MIDLLFLRPYTGRYKVYLKEFIMNLICAVRFAGFLALCSILPQSNAMRPHTVGFYGTYREFDYYSLDVIATNCVARVICSKLQFPGDDNERYIQFVVDSSSEELKQYDDVNSFDRFCESKKRIFNGNDLVLASIDECSRIFHEQQSRVRRISIFVLLTEVLLRLKQKA